MFDMFVRYWPLRRRPSLNDPHYFDLQRLKLNLEIPSQKIDITKGDDLENRVVQPFPILPNEILDNIFVHLGHDELVPFLFSRNTYSSARIALWKNLDFTPPVHQRIFNHSVGSSGDEIEQYDEDLKQYFRDCIRTWKWLKRQPDMPCSTTSPIVGEFLEACFNSESISEPFNLRGFRSRFAPVTSVVRSLTIGVPGRYHDAPDPNSQLRTVADMSPSDIQGLLNALPGLIRLTVYGIHLGPHRDRNQWPREVSESPRDPTRISIPACVKWLTVYDEWAYKENPKPRDATWQYAYDVNTADALNRFQRYENIEHLRYVMYDELRGAEELKGEGLAMIRLLPKFSNLKVLRIDNIPNRTMSTAPDDNWRRDDNNYRTLPYCGQQELFERLDEKLPKPCHTLDLRPRLAFLFTETFTQDWPEKVPHVRKLRIPIRNVFEALTKTQPSHAIHFEVLICAGDLKDHHGTPEKSYICPTLKLLEVLAEYFASQPNEHRSISFAVGNVYEDDEVWHVEPGNHSTWQDHHAWRRHMFRTVRWVSRWMRSLKDFAIPGSEPGLDQWEPWEFFDYLEHDMPARGNLGVECTERDHSSSLLHGHWDSEESEEEFGLYDSDGEPE